MNILRHVPTIWRHVDADSEKIAMMIKLIKFGVGGTCSENLMKIWSGVFGENLGTF